MIYFDNAATTKLKKEALDAMMPYLTEEYANPSAIYLPAGKCRRTVESAREIIADSIKADRSEIFFTSGGTESDNWAIRGVAESYANKGKHIITTAFEHHAVLNTCKALEREGCSVTWLKGNSEGFVTAKEVEDAIRPDTILVSVMTANNETGVIQPIEEIGEITRKRKVLFHTDAVQAYCHHDINVKGMKIDLMSCTAHKIGGPKGVGCLYKKNSVILPPFVYGGGQERDMRSGTENVAGCAGFAAAVSNRGNGLYVKELRDYLLNRLLKEIPGSSINGSLSNRLPGNINICFDNVRGESLIMRLSSLGIYISTGSACTSGQGASHVLKAMGLTNEKCFSSVRITLCDSNTYEEADLFTESVKEIITDLRQMRMV